MKKFVLAASALLAAGLQVAAMPFSNRITLPGGGRIFLSGFNLAWSEHNYGNDVGDKPLDEAFFREAFASVAASGGNVMRVWLSTNGANDPKFGPDGYVSGLGSHTIANVGKMLAIARENRMLLMPVLLSQNFMQEGQGDISRNRKLLATDTGLGRYIENALEPLVKAIGNDPNLVCWEVANEAEGMVEGTGWTDARIRKADVQRFTNRIAGAIKRAVPGVLVSTGIVTAQYLGWYSDAALKSAGGDADGTLDFYQIHYYGWNGPANSPFARDAKAWKVDKPLVVGEFASSSWGKDTPSSLKMQDALDIDTALETLYSKNYAGGLFWMYYRNLPGDWMEGFPSAGPSMARFGRAHPEAAGFRGAAGAPLNLVRNGDFGAGGSNWVSEVKTGNAGTILFSGGEASAAISATDGTNWGIQVRQHGIPIQAGETYVLSFDARSKAKRAIGIGLNTGSWVWITGSEVSITDTVTTYSVELRATVTTDGILQFLLGDAALPVWIDNVSLVRNAG